LKIQISLSKIFSTPSFQTSKKAASCLHHEQLIV